MRVRMRVRVRARVRARARVRVRVGAHGEHDVGHEEVGLPRDAD